MSLSASPPTLTTEDIGPTRVITLNRPQRMNAIDVELACGLRDAVVQASKDPAVRALVITGRGLNFCTGGDVRRDRTLEQAANIDLVDVVQEVFLALRQGDKPSIAMVRGHALGAGLSLMLACDFALCDDTARLAARFTHVGLIPDMGLAITLPERVGLPVARDMVLCGSEKNAAEALAIGLVDLVCTPGELQTRVMEKANVLAAQAPLALAAARRQLYANRLGIEECLREEKRLQNEIRATEDAREGIAAFTEKRPPVFKGR